MTIRFVLESGRRRPLANALAEILSAEARYLGAPTFCFEVGGCTIDKDGTLHIPEGMDGIGLLQKLEALGFAHEPLVAEEQAAVQDPVQEPEPQQEFVQEPMLAPAHEAEQDSAQEPEPLRTAIRLPVEDFDDAALLNLIRLVEAKAELIRMSLQTDALEITMEDSILCFDWWEHTLSPEELAAYTQFLSALCRTAKEQSRVSAKAAPVENPRYQMRCFLLKLGFIGEEYKAARKLLLAPLPGNGAFKHGKA